MKLVVNRCYGGFSLSPRAVKRLAELEGKNCYFFKMKIGDESYTPITIEEIEDGGRISFWVAFTHPNPCDVLKAIKNWHDMTQEERGAYNKLYQEINIDSRPEDRANKNLVRVVEELGKKANGAFANLEVVEIPDGVDWEIDDYDGMETIHEKHRSW